MKRMLYEWSAIFFTAASVLCVAYWGTSIYTDVADFNLAFGHRASLQIVAKNGSVNFTNNELDVDDVILGPKMTANLRWRLPGFGLRYTRFELDPPYWALKISLLIPACLMVFLAVFCFRRYRGIALKRPSVDRRNAATFSSGISRPPLAD